jgi:glycosyltransferase involved in cell wall biosynthesis
VKLIFLNRFFHPDHSATSQMLSDLAFALAKNGRDVAVITSRQRYDAPADSLPSRELVDGVSIYRVWTSRFGRAGHLGRIVDYLTFYLAAAWRLWRLARAGDVVVAKTDPPMLSVVAGPLCRRRDARLVNWLQDIFPEVAQAVGVGGRGARVLFLPTRWFRSRSLQAAHMNVVLGQRMAERVSGLGVRCDHIRVVPNWADGASVWPIDPLANALRREWQLDDAFVVGYSGNLGRAHEIETMLEAMALLEKPRGERTPRHPRVVWLFIGSGALFGTLQAEVARRGLTSARFKPYQPKARLAESLSAADVHLVSLRPALEGLIVPSKFYGVAAAGRPTVFIGDEDGEIARTIARHECGRTVAAGDGAALAQAIIELAGSPDLRGWMGQRARQAFEAEFDKHIALTRWEELLLDVSGDLPVTRPERYERHAARTPSPDLAEVPPVARGPG